MQHRKMIRVRQSSFCYGIYYAVSPVVGACLGHMPFQGGNVLRKCIGGGVHISL